MLNYFIYILIPYFFLQIIFNNKIIFIFLKLLLIIVSQIKKHCSNIFQVILHLRNFLNFYIFTIKAYKY